MPDPTLCRPLHRACPICGEGQGALLHTQRFALPADHPLTNGYDVACCARCGFVFADTVATQRDYDLFYAKYSKYEDDKTSTGGGENAWDAQRLRDSAAAIARFLPSREARILDMGCANGGLLKALKELGFANLLGIDPSAACVDRVRGRVGVLAQVGSLCTLPAQLGQFDCVILSHVLEHVQDLRQAVAAIDQLVAKEGCLYVEVPDAGRYAECLAAPFQDFNTEHINHFSHRCLANLMQQIGFAPQVEGHKTLASPPPFPFPAIFAFYRRSSRCRVVKDQQLARQIADYIHRSGIMMRAIDEHLRSTLGPSAEVIVWGTGQLAMKLLVQTVLGSMTIAAFVDNNPINHGKVLRGIPITAPQQVRGMPQPIIIATLLHHREIARTIRQELALSNRLVLLLPDQAPPADPYPDAVKS